MHPSIALRGALLSLAAFPLVAVTPASAQDGFLFEQPRFTVSARGGLNLASTGSDVYGFLTRQITLERGDFSGPAFFGEFGVRVLPRLDLVAGVGWMSTTSQSESRTHEGTDGLPILQSTTLSRMPLTLSARFYPLARGRSIGRHAWIPRSLSPFVAVGGGLLRYELEQSGEFVDYATCDAENVCDIFDGFVASSDVTETFHVAGGAEYWISSWLGLSAEARYQWASAPLDRTFIGFDDIDLAGFQTTIGLSARF